MNPWIAKSVVLAATGVMMAIRGPHGHRSRSVNVAKSHKTPLETGLLVFAWVGFLVPLIWVVSPAFWFADYPLRIGPLLAGVMCFVIGLWLFYRSHADLGTNWSITLEYARGIDLSHKAFIDGFATRCTRRWPSIPSARRSLSRTGSQVCRTWSRSRSFLRFVSARKRE